ncbi:MAG: flagellar hook-basal body protein [Planctomycetota bacterium]
MIQGLYSNAAAMDVLTQRQELISSNLAHMNTGGHRRSRIGVSKRSVPDFQGRIGELGPEVSIAKVDFSQGRLHRTGAPLDFAISGDGFFVVEGDGGELLTRNGRFHIDPDSNTLVNEEGFPAQGENGAIQIDSSIPASAISISANGTLSANGESLGKLRIAAFEDNEQLELVSATYFREGANAVAKESDASVQQYFMEMSNVNPVSELVALIVSSRRFEAAQRASKVISDTLRENIRA